jgi:TetR/AcrR family transcriptional regulator, transcriptional repressor of aconitase
MPTITEDSQRHRQQIVQSAVTCFLAKGIPETSMEEIVAGSGVSPDLAYQYYPRKNDILQTLGVMNKAAASGVLKEILKEEVLPPTDQIISRVAVFFEMSVLNGDPVGVAPQAWGVAIYDSEVADIMADVFAELRDVWVQLATRMVDEGRLPAGTDPGDVGRTFFAIVLGFILQSLLSDGKADQITRGLQVLLR